MFAIVDSFDLKSSIIMVPPPGMHVFYRALIISFCIPALLLTACGGEDTDISETIGEEHITERGGVLHPLPQFIPHHDHKHIPIAAAPSIEKLEDVPDQITLLAEYLDDPASKEVRALDVHVSNSARAFRVEYVGDSRLVMLGTVPYDGFGNGIPDYEERLVEYDLATSEYVSLDTVGGVPRDFRNAKDMAYRDKVLYVQSHGWRITRFDCVVSPCRYDSSLNLTRSLRSVTPVTSSRLAGLGPAPITQEVHDENVPPSELFQDVVRVFDLEERKAKLEEGSEIRAFGAAYDSQVYRFNLVFMNNTRLAYSTDAGRYALTYTPFPYLYVYNREGQFTASYRFDDDTEPAVEYRQASEDSKYNWLERDPQRSYFLIADIEGLALVLRESIEAASPGEDGSGYNYDYYAVDLPNDEVYHVGTDAYVGQHAKMMYPTDAGLVLNEGGALQFIEK